MSANRTEVSGHSGAGHFRRKLVSLYLDIARRVWRYLPAPARNSRAGRTYARHIDSLIRRHANRRQYVATFFLRNRPEIQLLRRLAEQQPCNSSILLCVMACSKGAEVYSMVWAIRSARPDLQLTIHAVDIAEDVVEFAAAGVYSLRLQHAVDLPDGSAKASEDDLGRGTARDQNASMFERVTPDEIAAMFEVEGDQARVRPWLRQGITWLCADASAPSLAARLGLQDIVVANRFLCHMQPGMAAECLRKIARLVKPGGYLFVSGIDLDVRTKVAIECGWTPVTDSMREIHDGDQSIRRGWPLEYWGLEPFDDSRPDWRIRYASVFRIGSPADGSATEAAVQIPAN